MGVGACKSTEVEIDLREFEAWADRIPVRLGSETIFEYDLERR